MDKGETSIVNSQLPILNYKIDGIDLEMGLERFGGDGNAYLQVLRSYCVNTRNLLGSLEEINKENLNDYVITVHGIKGSSRNICANPVGDIAELLERAAEEGDLRYVNEKTPDLMQAVVKLLIDLDHMLAKISAEAHKPVKVKPDKELLVKIREACKTFDMKTAETAVKELESYEYETNGDLVPWLWENVQQFNVDEIIGELTKMSLDNEYA
jgi:HPt (histidine-containing phosphotransfer) domain-containing protein